VHSQHIGPQLFVAEGIEPEDGLPVGMTSGTLWFGSSSSRFCLGGWRSPGHDEGDSEKKHNRGSADESHIKHLFVDHERPGPGD
jgi:hypothetical protein